MNDLQEVVDILGKNVEDVRDLGWQWMELIEGDVSAEIVTEQESMPL